MLQQDIGYIQLINYNNFISYLFNPFIVPLTRKTCKPAKAKLALTFSNSSLLTAQIVLLPSDFTFM